jgi:hypothetical protein
MPSISIATIAPYHPLRRVKIISQRILAQTGKSRIAAKPNKRFSSVCYGRNQQVCAAHCWGELTVRDPSITVARLRYRDGILYNYLKSVHETIRDS